MDVVLEILDPLILDKAYAWALLYPGVSLSNSSSSNLSSANAMAPTSPWLRDHIYRQITSILLVTQLGATSLYLVFSALSYYFIFDRRLEYHPRFLQNQIRQEIKSSLSAVLFINLLTLPLFLAEIRSKNLLHSNVNDYGWPWLLFSSILYMAFNNLAIYWIHRLEYHPCVYKYIHKPHHKWIVPAPWAALAFHSLDGYVQFLPYHISVFIWPMQRYLYMILFTAVQIWTIVIHDGDMITGHWTGKFINSPAHLAPHVLQRQLWAILHLGRHLFRLAQSTGAGAGSFP